MSIGDKLFVTLTWCRHENKLVVHGSCAVCLKERDPFDAEEFYFRRNDSTAELQERSPDDLEVGLGMPCPFCGAENFTKYPLFKTAPTHHFPQTCSECKRTAVFVQESVVDKQTQQPVTLFEPFQVKGRSHFVRDIPVQIAWIH